MTGPNSVSTTVGASASAAGQARSMIGQLEVQDLGPLKDEIVRKMVKMLRPRKWFDLGFVFAFAFADG